MISWLRSLFSSDKTSKESSISITTEDLFMATKFCIFSGSHENLNTSMVLKLDDGKTVEVWVSDEHTDNATPKAVREAYLESQGNILRLNIEAAKYGFKLVPIGAPNVPIQPTPESKNVDVDRPVSAPSIRDTPSESSRRVREFRPNIAAMPLPDAPTLEGAESYNINTDDDAVVKNVVVNIGGVPVPITTSSKDRNGSLEIEIVPGGGNKGINSNHGENFREGYTIKEIRCPLCRGTRLMAGNKTCAKCNGVGAIEVA